MYTYSLGHSHIYSVFFQNALPESGIIHDSTQEKDKILEKDLREIKSFSEEVANVLAQNPVEKQKFIDNLQGMHHQVLQDPKNYRLFINKLFENFDTKLSSLNRDERKKAIEEFTVSMTAIMHTFARLHDIPRLSLAIDAQKKALEIKYSDIKKTTADASKMLRGEITLA